MPTKAHAAVLDRRTSQTLGMILRRLAKRSEVPIEELAADLEVTRGALYKVFNGDNGLTYQLLERFERRLGVPTGIILCISHSTALIHHAKYNDDPAERGRSLAALNRMIAYLGSLRVVLTKPERHPKRLKYLGDGIPHGPLWNDMIDEIMDATRGTKDPLAPTEFTDPRFIPSEAEQRPEQVLKPTPRVRKKSTARAAASPSRRCRKASRS